LLFFLVGAQLGGTRAFFNALAGDISPIHLLVHDKTDDASEHSHQHYGQNPARLLCNAFKRLFGRKKYTNNAAEMIDWRLRFGRGNCGCSHRGLLHHKVA
jgi:hypothetical protein